VNCLHELFEAQARRTPQHPALAFEGERLTYAELDRRAGQLAAELQRLGAAPDVRIGLLVERSASLVVALLGILKSGAAYVPVDTAYPSERVAYMLADCGAKLVVTQASLLAKLQPTDAHAVLIDRLDARGAALPSTVGAENLAYVIYTSGSTGRPKGVGVEHRNIVNYVAGVAERLRLEPGMSYATVSTIAADLGNTVIFPALATGGCLHVIAQERAESAARLAEYFARERIDVLKIVPSHLAALQSGRDAAEVMPARRLILGGEASRLDWIERLRSLAPGCEIFNHYGPTEATVGVLTYAVGSSLPSTPTGTLPLGRPLPGSSIHLLDPRGQPVAPGEKGELCIGGRGVARGYLNRAELTAERFVRDPFSAAPGARLYRTGDLARALPDGNFEFCGRVDHQVKVHGYRVELGEIEAALRSHGAVEDAVVLARDGELVAYVSGAPALPGPFAEEPSPGVLREHLKSSLPPYMVPAMIVRLDKMPLTANGKVDRQALAARPVETAAPSCAYVAPRTETEKALAAIWGELLKADVGIDDDVFDLGAHSLMAMKALTRVRDAFGVDLALRNLFEHPTVAGLAQAIDSLALAVRRPAGAGEREELVL
jgi:amino acid adenylation domain-containing protein